jgi:coenzyme F420-reducing hydrogenase gamma subunit
MMTASSLGCPPSPRVIAAITSHWLAVAQTREELTDQQGQLCRKAADDSCYDRLSVLAMFSTITDSRHCTKCDTEEGHYDIASVAQMLGGQKLTNSETFINRIKVKT